MEIKNITLKSIDRKGLKAICSVNFDDLLVVHKIRLIEGKEGMFLSFPARIIGDGDFLDIVHPIDSSFRKDITDAIVKQYKFETGQE